MSLSAMGQLAGSETTRLQALDPRLQSLLLLVQMEREIRRLKSCRQLGYMMVNETNRLVPCDQAVLLVFPGFKTATEQEHAESAHDCTDSGPPIRSPIRHVATPRVEAISSVSQLDREAPYLIWLQSVVKQLAQTESIGEVSTIDSGMLTPVLGRSWTDWCTGHVLWCPLVAASGVLIGGLWLVRKEAWLKSDKVLLERLADAYAYSWQMLAPRSSRLLVRLSGRIKWLVPLLFLLAMIPVRQSVLAPAQVVARHPVIVTAPLEGVIKDIYVKPNQRVHPDEALFSLDDTNIRNRYRAAIQAQAVAEANYLRASQQAFTNPRRKSELAAVKAVLDEKQAEIDYNAELLQRINVTAKQAGVVVFDDANDWLGKPVKVGEKIMTLADIHDTWLEVWLPVDDAIVLEPGARLRLFLNIDPLASFNATLEQTSYEARLSPQGILSYRIKAGFDADQPLPRLGLKGTAKIYAARVTLAYYIFRRPLAVSRRWLGL